MARFNQDNQGINIAFPDEALKYVTPKIAMNDETLLYILQVPKLDDESSTTMLVVPLTINNTIIINHPQHLIKNNDKLYTTSTHKNFVQRHSDIQELRDECIKPLVMGTESHCNVTAEVETRIQFLSENKLVINNAINDTLTSDCGPNDRILSGNFLITFENCTIKVNRKQFQSYEIRSEIQEMQGALYNIQATRRLITIPNIEMINQENIQNRNQIKNVYLKQIGHQNWIWTLSGGVSLSSIGILILIIYIAVYNKTPATIKMEKATISTPQPCKANLQWSNLLIRAGIKLKDEDALSSPPGVVISQQDA